MTHLVAVKVQSAGTNRAVVQLLSVSTRGDGIANPSADLANALGSRFPTLTRERQSGSEVGSTRPVLAILVRRTGLGLGGKVGELGEAGERTGPSRHLQASPNLGHVV